MANRWVWKVSTSTVSLKLAHPHPGQPVALEGLAVGPVDDSEHGEADVLVVEPDLLSQPGKAFSVRTGSSCGGGVCGWQGALALTRRPREKTVANEVPKSHLADGRVFVQEIAQPQKRTCQPS